MVLSLYYLYESRLSNGEDNHIIKILGTDSLGRGALRLNISEVLAPFGEEGGGEDGEELGDVEAVREEEGATAIVEVDLLTRSVTLEDEGLLHRQVARRRAEQRRGTTIPSTTSLVPMREQVRARRMHAGDEVTERYEYKPFVAQ